MIQQRILGLVTARGGSKRVPRKNIKNFLGKPLLAWTVEVGLESKVFDRFVLTTDDTEIATIGQEYGVEVPFIRPSSLAEDTTSSYDTIVHAVEWLKEQEQFETEWIILLEPSSPGRQTFHIEEVARLIEKRSDVDSIIGISEIPGHFSHRKELQRDESGIVSRVGDGEILKNLVHRNQDIQQSFYINSAIYAFKTNNLYDGDKSLWGSATLGYVMDDRYALDIDTPEDWIIAEVKMKKLLEDASLS